MSQSENPLAQSLICTSSASEATGNDRYVYTAHIRVSAFDPFSFFPVLSRDKRDIDASRLLSITGDYE